MGSSQSKDSIVSVSEELKEGVSRYVDVVLKLGEKEITRLEAGVEKPEDTGGEKSSSSDLIDTEVTILHKLGLGRGIDGTDSRPWVNKTAFQVREVNSSNLIRTDEGGIVHAFYEEVTSISEQKANLKLSVTVPSSPVEVTAGADISRTLTTTRKAFGKRILSETVAFKPTFDGSEERLAECVLELIELGASQEEQGQAAIGSPGLEKTKLTFVQRMAEYPKEVQEKYLLAFLERYRVTHYVSSVTLGASKFVVLTDSEYERVITTSADSKINFESVGSIELPSGSFKKDLKKYSRNIQYIGRFKDEGSVDEDKDSYKNAKYEVEKEAVVSVKLEPISNLIKTGKFRDQMKEALEMFIEKQNSKKEGPFIISCKDAKVYLKVNVDEQTDHARVFATDNAKEASNFYILRTDDGEHSYEFYIGWQSKASEGKVQGTMRYLTATARVLGRHDGPLCLESRARKYVSLFSINRRLTDPFYRLSGDKNVNPNIWFRGEESFLIRCTRRRGRIDGFVAVERIQGGDEKYKTVSRRNPRGHDDGNFHMAFRLHPIDDLEKLPNYKAEPAERSGASNFNVLESNI